MNNKSNKHFWVIIIGCAIIAMLISLFIGMRQSVWFDEAYSILIAKQPIGQLIHLTALDTHPPLFYIILKIWGNIFGWSELALRTMPILFMGGAVVCSALLMQKLFNRRAAVITLPLVVLAPFLLRYGFEIRMYSLASLIGVLATYILVCALRTSEKRKKTILFCVYALLVAVGVYTLYYLVLLWVAHLVWLIWLTKQEKESIIKSPWLLSYCASFVLFIPWLPTFISQITNGALAPIAMPMTIDNFLSIFSFSIFYSPSWDLGLLLFLVLLAAIVFLLSMFTKAFQAAKITEKANLLLLTLYIAIPIILLTIVGFIRPMYVERYLSHVLIGASLWIGASMSIVLKISKTYIKVFYAIFLVFLIAGIFNLTKIGNYNFQRSQTIDMKEAVLGIECSEKDIILAADPYEAIEASYYLSKCPIYFYSESAEQIGGYSILSNSKYRVTKPSVQLADKRTIYYIHYNSNLKLDMPPALVLKDKHQFGKLGLDKYSISSGMTESSDD